MRWCALAIRVPCAAAAMALCVLSFQAFAAAPGGQPQRIVSLDYCADQFVLELAEPGMTVEV